MRHFGAIGGGLECFGVNRVCASRVEGVKLNYIRLESEELGISVKDKRIDLCVIFYKHIRSFIFLLFFEYFSKF